MKFIILCELKSDSAAARKELRLNHLEYVRANRENIFVGGPALGTDGAPETMLMIVETATAAEAEKFINAEPYWASGRVFESYKIRSWSQVLPEPAPNALTREIEKERESLVNQAER